LSFKKGQVRNDEPKKSIKMGLLLKETKTASTLAAAVIAMMTVVIMKIIIHDAPLPASYFGPPENYCQLSPSQ